MKYFFDTEFIEGFHKPLFGKVRHFIDLISIGIVAEDGRQYSAISSEYNYDDASDWVKENVIIPAYIYVVPGPQRQFCSEKKFNKHYGKSNAKIAQEIVSFVNPITSFAGYNFNNEEVVPAQLEKSERMREEFIKHNVVIIDGEYYVRPEFYAYYADYDWVLFCSLFGTMMDLPKGFPMYCVDLKQMIDGRVKHFMREVDSARNTTDQVSFDRQLELFKQLPGYPKQENEHLAISDAQWNKKLYDFLIQ